jgi:hypothetical protein
MTTSYPRTIKVVSKSVLSGSIATGVEAVRGASLLNGVGVGLAQAVVSTAVQAYEYNMPSYKSGIDEAHEQRYIESLSTGALYTGAQLIRGVGSPLKNFLIATGSSLVADVLTNDAMAFYYGGKFMCDVCPAAPAN